MNHVKRDWNQYNQKLINRGSITFWLDQECLNSWVKKSKKRGRPSFNQSVIQAGWIIKSVYRLSLRALQGLLESILCLLKVELHSPHYSLFCKRAKEAADNLPKLSNRRPTDLIIDSSGLKVAGEGEWKVKIHGSEKRRGWIKLHIGIDPKTQEVIALEVTDDKTADSQVLPLLVDKAPKSVTKVLADGAYDGASCRGHLLKKQIEACIPPRRKGRQREGDAYNERNSDLKVIELLGGDEEAFKLWKTLVGYHKRSLVETAFSRLKRLFGDRLNNKTFKNLQAETTYRCHALNRMNRIQSIN